MEIFIESKQVLPKEQSQQERARTQSKSKLTLEFMVLKPLYHLTPISLKQKNLAFTVYLESENLSKKKLMTKEQRQYNEAKIALSTNGAEATGQPHAKKKKKKNLDTDLTPFTHTHTHTHTKLTQNGSQT